VQLEITSNRRNKKMSFNGGDSTLLSFNHNHHLIKKLKTSVFRKLTETVPQKMVILFLDGDFLRHEKQKLIPWNY